MNRRLKGIYAQLRAANEEHPWLTPVTLFFIAFVVFLSVQLIPAIPDPDSFYHIAMAEEIRDHGFFRDFVWLSDFTVLGEAFADQHFLYHVFLIPFVTWLPPFVGAKFATTLLASLSVVSVYLLFRALKFQSPFWFAFVLLLVNPYTFRMGLIKAPSIGIIFIFLAMMLMVRLQYAALFFMSAIFVWAYGAFPLLLGIVGLYALVRGASTWMTHTRRHVRWQKKVRRLWDVEIRLVLSVLAGIIVGLIVNPFFPNNVRFYWVQTVQIALLNFQDSIGVGGEWYPYGFIELLSNTVFVSILGVIALVLFAIFIRRMRAHTVTFLCVAIVFFMLTLKSRRYVEYEVPLVLLFSASAISDALKAVDLKHEMRKLRTWFWSHQMIGMILLVYFAIAVPTVVMKDYVTERMHYTSGIPVTQFQDAMGWLTEYHAMQPNADIKPIIFHSDWDEFPILMYHNRNARYIAGLDPTFMYLADADRHAEWVEITTGQYDGDVADALKNDFHASYVLVAQDHESMDRLIRRSGLPKIYEDADATLYQVQ